MRHLFIRLPDSLVVPILEHAKGEPAESGEPEKKGEDGKGKDDEASVVEAVEATAS